MILNVLTPELNVTEGDSGEVTVVTACFSANLTQPRAVNHPLELIISSNSTADFGSDFYTNTSIQFLTIPAGVTDSMYTTCVDLTIIGDDFAEPTEFIIITISPLVPQDSVLYPPGFSFVNITIFDNNDTGMLLGL